eukprot:TRINITY_DN671_c0_g1_i10.p1 TRINITY_DN671_c0_g1~~TRINITY_DN671_c0_g1_i10.p1  ORF type:complete len:210 (-),score=22.88 TRINITY_DN671_c0_g1_i10:13-642(-)
MNESVTSGRLLHWLPLELPTPDVVTTLLEEKGIRITESVTSAILYMCSNCRCVSILATLLLDEEELLYYAASFFEVNHQQRDSRMFFFLNIEQYLDIFGLESLKKRFTVPQLLRICFEEKLFPFVHNRYGCLKDVCGLKIFIPYCSSILLTSESLLYISLYPGFWAQFVTVSVNMNDMELVFCPASNEIWIFILIARNKEEERKLVCTS